MITKSQRISAEKLDELDAAYDGRIIHAWQDALPRRNKQPEEGAVEWECVFRVPNRRELQIFYQQIDSSASSATRALAPETLARSCVAAVAGSDAEPKTAFDALLDKYPAIPARVATALAKLAGFDAAEIEK